jgi:hypothetical protein
MTVTNFSDSFVYGVTFTWKLTTIKIRQEIVQIEDEVDGVHFDQN